MEKIYADVSRWNEARYEREFNEELASGLLNEELDEYEEAGDDIVKKLDALGDTVYVALGALWKLNLSEEEFHITAIAASEVTDHINKVMIVPPVCFARAYLQSLKQGNEYAVNCHAIIYCCLNQMMLEGLEAEEALGVVRAICKSNNTKSAKKTASNVKANDKDKGDSYIPPTEMIKLIWERACERRNSEICAGASSEVKH